MSRTKTLLFFFLEEEKPSKYFWISSFLLHFLCPHFCNRLVVIWGFKVIYVLLFAIWLHSELFFSYPMLSCWFNFLDIKAVKELYERKQEKIGSQDIFYFCLYFWVQQQFSGWGNSSWIQMKWFRLQVKVLKCVSHS